MSLLSYIELSFFQIGKISFCWRKYKIRHTFPNAFIEYLQYLDAHFVNSTLDIVFWKFVQYF